MAATFTWHIEHCERTASDGAIFFVRWRCDASEIQGEGEDSVTYTKQCHGTTGFTPDSSSSDFVQYESITQEQVVTWVWANNEVSKEDIHAGLQEQLTEEFSPTVAEGLPW
tara:strand:- start:436 stop:768 length:333 start_codon:yes stop_codon:yes gene_type:complete